MLIKKILLLSFVFSSVVHANAFDSLKEWKDWQGKWELGSVPSCGRTPGVYEDALMAKHAKNFTWEFAEENTVVEKLDVEDCHTEITYKVEFLSKDDPAPGPAFMRKMRLTRQKFISGCFVPEYRPETLTVGLLSYPDFFETQEYMADDKGPCPENDSVTTQFRRIK